MPARQRIPSVDEATAGSSREDYSSAAPARTAAPCVYPPTRAGSSCLPGHRFADTWIANIKAAADQPPPDPDLLYALQLTEAPAHTYGDQCPAGCNPN